MKYNKGFFTGYTILWLLLGVILVVTAPACARVKVVKVPKPHYPPMEDVTITKDCVCGEELDKVINNMLCLQRHVDELSTNPCWKEDK